LKKLGITSQAAVRGKKYIITRDSVSVGDHPATPLDFVDRKVQHQLELMMAITNYASFQESLNGDEPSTLIVELESDERPLLLRYQQEFRERVLPAIRGVSDLLHGKVPTLSRGKDQYIKLK
jgi:hypothetical protein